MLWKVFNLEIVLAILFKRNINETGYENVLYTVTFYYVMIVVVLIL